MRTARIGSTAKLIALALTAAVLQAKAADTSRRHVEIESGMAAFDSGTNMPGIEVKGKSYDLSAHAEAAQEGNRLVLQSIDATVPIKSLTTGMKLRDEHMRKYIFTDSRGGQPNLHFAAESVACPAAVTPVVACAVAGTLSIRGVSRPFNVSLRIKDQVSAFKVEGDGVVKLSDYGIEAPSQFGVKPNNEVTIHLEFTGKQKPQVVANAGVGK